MIERENGKAGCNDAGRPKTGGPKAGPAKVRDSRAAKSTAGNERAAVAGDRALARLLRTLRRSVCHRCDNEPHVGVAAPECGDLARGRPAGHSFGSLSGKPATHASGGPSNSHAPLTVDGRPDPSHAEATIREALSLGLAEECDGRLVATRAATSFLRRAMLAREEAFAGQHREIVDTQVEIDGQRQTARRNLNESPLGLVARMKDRSGGALLPAEAVEAGERLLSDFTRGQLQPRVTASWEPRLASRSGGGGHRGGMAELAETAVAARLRFSRAMDAMGPELSGVAADVCCFGKGLEQVERERQWPARSAKLMLRTALLHLARHYAPPPARPGRHSHRWGADDFRPAMRS